MLIGYSSLKKKGYDAQELINVIGTLIDHEVSLNVAVVGMGNLGRAITSYFMESDQSLNIVAAFDIDPKQGE
jgi:redox-sensing transcriptional repressor